MSEALRRALAGPAPENHVDDATLAAYLDGSLDSRERLRAEEHLGRCPRCAQDLATAARVELEATAQRAVETPTATRGTSRSTATRETSRSPSAGPRTSRPASRTWLRLAAGIVLVFGALLLGRSAGRLAATRLAPALATRLADWTGRRVSIGGSGVVLAGGPGIALYDVAIADDPRFSQTNFAFAQSVALHVQPQALLDGRFAGSLELGRPSLRLVRNSAGDWNVETLGSGARKPPSPASRDEIERALDEATRGHPPAQADATFLLASARVDGGTLEIQDAGNGRTLRVRDVDLSYEGQPGERALLSVDGAVGNDRDRIALRGEIGPFEGDAIPVYRFSQVELQRVPVDEIPGAPAAVLGLLTFAGRLESAGRSWSDVVAAARGGGQLGLCCGALEGGNVARQIVSELGSLPGGEALLAAAGAPAALGASLDASVTAYEQISANAELEPGTLHLTDVVLQSALFRANLDASLALEGPLAATGSFQLAPELSAILVAAAPVLAPLTDERGALNVPFRAEGVWPNLAFEIDAAQALARVLTDPRSPGRPGRLLAWLTPLFG